MPSKKGRHSKAVTEQILGQRGNLMGDLFSQNALSQLNNLGNRSAFGAEQAYQQQLAMIQRAQQDQIDALRYANHRHYLTTSNGIELMSPPEGSRLTRKRYEGDELTFHERLQYEVNEWLKPVRR